MSVRKNIFEKAIKHTLMKIVFYHFIDNNFTVKKFRTTLTKAVGSKSLYKEEENLIVSMTLVGLPFLIIITGGTIFERFRLFSLSLWKQHVYEFAKYCLWYY